MYRCLAASSAAQRAARCPAAAPSAAVAALAAAHSSSAAAASSSRAPAPARRIPQRRHRSTLASSPAHAAPGPTPAGTSARSYGNSAPAVSAASDPGSSADPPPTRSSARSSSSSSLSPMLQLSSKRPMTQLPTPLPADIIDRLELFRSNRIFESFAAPPQPAKRSGTADTRSEPAQPLPAYKLHRQQKAEAEFAELSYLVTPSTLADDAARPSTPTADSTPPRSARRNDAFYYTQSEALFPTSRKVENLSILKACLATGMLSRAETLFDRLRYEYFLRTRIAARSHDAAAPESGPRIDLASRIPDRIYDLILDCYLYTAASLAQNAAADPFSSFGGASASLAPSSSPAAAAKAAATTAAIRTYVQRAWALFGMMASQQPAFLQSTRDESSTRQLKLDAAAAAAPGTAAPRAAAMQVDPTPSAATLSVMMRGIVRLKQLGAYPRAVIVPGLSGAGRRQYKRRGSASDDGASAAGGGSGTAEAVENERLFRHAYARIPDGIITQDCPALDVLLETALRYQLTPEAVFGSSVLDVRMPHSIREAELADAPAAAADADADASASASARAMPEPSVPEMIEEAIATADRMGNVALAVQLRALLESRAQKAQEKASAAAAEAPAPTPLPGSTPEELQATVPVVQPVLTSAENNPGKAPTAEGLVEPFNLTNLKENLSIVAQSRKLYSDPYDRQEWLELASIEAARKRLAHSSEQLESIGLQEVSKLQSKSLQAMMWSWYQAYQPRLKADIERLATTKSRAAEEADILPYLKFMPVHKLALLPILEVMRIFSGSGMQDGVRTARLLILIGKAVEAECMTWVVSQNPGVYAKVRESHAKMRAQGVLDPATREDIQAARSESTSENVLEQGLPRWTQGLRSRVGGFLMQHLLEAAKVHRSKVDEEGVLWEEDQPAFHSTYQYLGGKKLGVVRLNQAISERLDRDPVDDTISPRYLPMLVPPRLWESDHRGGYLAARTSLMRYKDSAEQGSYLRAACKNNGLEPVMAGLDILGQTPWMINADVLRVIAELWNRGEHVGKLPPKELEEPEPARPENFDSDLSQRAVYLKRLREWTMNSAALHSQRCDVNYKLEIARSYLGERFYLPHNMDFRGRAYPIPPHLHHLGSDLSRGLLRFADAKPLQATGLRWLRVHLANLYGLDKVSFEERVQFARDNEENIRASAADPINVEWWRKAEDPFQCLAACFELARAAEYPGGPEAYPCSLPVHQDGTCNGLQHYAALGGDMEGARQVNLSRGDAPADVYTGVADLVIARVNEAAAGGSEVAQMLVGKVTRKVVKQTVMTTVYGVTLIGAKAQVMRRLHERKDIPAEMVWLCGGYLARLIIDCIGDVFQGAQAIQTWLFETASLVSKSIHKDRIEHAIQYKQREEQRTTANRLTLEQMTSVIWQTPLGLPVVQPYRRLKKKQMATAVQTVFIHDPLICTQVAPKKQASAFPPNFVHSLDATHMLLTALECHSAGLTFASVHDSYWTHACDIDTMSDIIRDTFVRLHSQDILGRLREEFLERYKDHYLPVVRLKAEDRARLLRSEAGEGLVVAAEGEVPAGAVEAEVVIDASQRRAAAEEGEGEGEGEEGEEAVLSEEDAAEAEDAGSSTPARKRAKKAIAVRTRFVELSKMIRPLPAKGTFDVAETKKSLYFFS